MASKKKVSQEKVRVAASEPPDVEVQSPATRAEMEAAIRSIARTCRGPLDPAIATQRDEALASGDPEKAKALDAQRQPCGQDFNETILANPLDGQEHTAVCKNCGVTTTYRAPTLG